MSPQIYYETELAAILVKEQADKRADTFFLVAKITSFLSFIVLGYFFFKHDRYFLLVGSLLCLCVYIAASYFDARHARKMARLAAMKAFVRQEIAYLSGDTSQLFTGDQYINRKHEYSLDLDIFGAKSLFQAVNRTVTKEGQNLLANWLQTSCTPNLGILERQAAVKELAGRTAWRLNYQAVGRQEELSAARLLQLSNESLASPLARYPKALYWATGAFTTVTLVILVFAVIGLVSSNLFFVFATLQLCFAYSFTKPLNTIASQLNGMQKSFARYHELLSHFCKEDFQSPRIRNLQQLLEGGMQEYKVLLAFKQLKQIVEALDRRANIFGNIVFNGLLMHDIYIIRNYRKWIETYAADFSSWIDAFSELDALNSIANFTYNHPEFIFPVPDNSTLVTAKEMGHPLIARQKVVCNDFEMQAMHQFCIVTGANMAGKSTFLRTVGVNLVLAACGAPVCAVAFRFSPMQLFSSMRAADDLSDDTSYFKAELVRLRSMIDCIQSNEKTFVILDEILKGTNSVDKLKGSRLFLERLLTMRASGLIATHDLALGELEDEQPAHFRNACFEIHIGNGQIRYDYKLLPGVTQNLNATQLIQQMLLDY